MKRLTSILTVVLGLSLVLAACGSNNEVTKGAKDMKKILVEIKSAVDAGSADEAKSQAASLEKSWASFEEEVEDKSKDVYDKVESPLHIIEAGVEVQPLDQDTLNKAISQLDEVLNEVESL